MNSIAVCFVCLGNICRSPSAEAVFLHCVAQAKLADRIVVDSAGTGDWHIGQPPDERAQRAARRRGYDLSPLRGRQITADDFAHFDLLIAMDDANAAALTEICPKEHRDKIRLLMEFATRDDSRVVVDPYFGGDDGFERVLDQCEDACEGLLKALRTQLVV
ncbi:MULTISPECIES: low molecular weight protein-tyrosine-phosphatase [unclassified Caballeronia]|uniref:low molecular weight protein-tyrosine-phosphatase n=1 Tax=unclassified Caballeronia TaxID=2646786 RepID=UPI0028674FCE|nr:MULTISPECIES: low molecular weight protein-tyrosine-phosphatase [unclassified Caballeronia]MDR5750155.1 low molecular weight phosphotyrosine protein phosphatase [Caballeronia sp. LZ024]MDR5842717.1 low molecular weight phosphotyrosine protein phosphatase [Caballeronia sp. LZ031]